MKTIFLSEAETKYLTQLLEEKQFEVFGNINKGFLASSYQGLEQLTTLMVKLKDKEVLVD